MKHKEEKILGILAIIFGALALLGSWLPIISILAFFFAIVAIALGVLVSALISKIVKYWLSSEQA